MCSCRLCRQTNYYLHSSWSYFNTKTSLLGAVLTQLWRAFVSCCPIQQFSATLFCVSGTWVPISLFCFDDHKELNSLVGVQISQQLATPFSIFTSTTYLQQNTTWDGNYTLQVQTPCIGHDRHHPHQNSIHLTWSLKHHPLYPKNETWNIRNLLQD